MMVISELALGYLTNLIYDSSKKIPGEIFDTYSKVYNKAIEEFSNKNYKLNGIQIDTFFHQKNVEDAIKRYLKNPDKLDCSNIFISEFFKLFHEKDFSQEDANSILNTFFEIIDAEIEKYPELLKYLGHYLAKQTYHEVQETNQGVQELSQGVKEISQKVQEMHKVINGDRTDQSRKDLDTNFGELIKKYLNKIIEEDREFGISEVYTELSAKGILPITLKFLDKKNDKTQEFDVLELVEKEEKLIISGGSGSGKTTTLRWLNFTFATRYLEKEEGIIPLYVELNSYKNGSFYAYFKRQIKKKGLSEVFLTALLEGKAIILLDGLDLLSSTDNFSPYDEISDFFSEYSNCRIVISSRPGFFESIRRDFKVSELEKLTDEKIQKFIDKYVPDKKVGYIIKDKIFNDKQLKSILTTPLMLYLAIEVAMERRNKAEELIPSNRSEMYEAFISGLFNHYETKIGMIPRDRVQVENALTELYFELQCRNKVSCKYREALKIVKKYAEDPTFRKTTPQDILEDSIKLGLLTRKYSEIEYGIHQSFQEYFAAIKLKELYQNGFDVSETFSHPKWEEVIMFTSEMLDYVDEFIDSIIFKGELFLASKCVTKASDETKEKICSLLSDKMDYMYELEKINSIKSLGKIGTAGISIIAKFLKDENRSVRCNAAEVLGNIKSEEAVKPLICALSDEDEDVRAEAAIALGYIKSDKAVEPLICLLKDESVYVRLGTIFALEKIKAEKAVEPLICIMNDKDEDEYVRVYAIEALREIKSEKAVEPLIHALGDENEEVRLHAAQALRQMKPDETWNTKICTFKDEGAKDAQKEVTIASRDLKFGRAVESPKSVYLKKMMDVCDWEKQKNLKR